MDLEFNSAKNKTEYPIGSCKCIIIRELKLNIGSFSDVKLEIIYPTHNNTINSFPLSLKSDTHTKPIDKKHILKLNNNFIKIKIPNNTGIAIIKCLTNSKYNFKLTIDLI